MLQPEDIFDEARRLEGEERDRYLAAACGGDDALRRRIESLLRADADAGGFLASLGEDWNEEDLASQSEAPGQHIDRYKLLERIGEGGFGEVWMAEQTEPVRRRVALKVIKLGMDTRQVIARFEAERQALAMMAHPNIAGVLDAGATATGRPYFVMELVRGVPLIEYCDSRTLDTHQRLTLFLQVCSALAHAHQKGIIHRDVKPSNVLVTLHDGEPVAKVIDFGIAKATNAELTQKTFFTAHRQMIGTPAYMSPEQASLSGLDVDTRADVYSLGVLLYELLTGTTPFDTRSLLRVGLSEMLRTIREEDPQTPSARLSSLGDTGTRTAELRGVELRRLATTLRGDLDWIVMKCLEKDRRRRYETVQDLAADLRRNLSAEPVMAAPPSRVYRASKFIRRNRIQVMAATLVAAVLVLGTLGTSLGLAMALRAQDRADAAAQAATQAAAQEAEARRAAEASEQRAVDETERALLEAQRASEAAARAQDAEDDAHARADELRQVVRFQHHQLAGVKPEAMGSGIRDSILESRRRAARVADLPDEAVAEIVSDLEHALSHVNFTDIALDALYEHIFSPAIATIETEFQQQPEVQATLLRTVANTMHALDLLPASLEVLTSALELHRNLFGEADDSTLELLRLQGVILRRLGRYDEAEAALREAADTRRRVHGPEHPRTLNALNSLQVLLEARGRIDESAALRAEVLEISRRTLGDDHMQTLTAQTNMAHSLQHQGRHEDAEELLVDAVERLRRVAGPEARFTLSAMGMLIDVYFEQNKHEDARAIVHDRLEIAQRVYGESHAHTVAAMQAAATLARADGDQERSESLLRAAIENSRASVGDDHPQTAWLLVRLSDQLVQQNRFEDAEPLERLLLSGYRTRHGEDSPHALAGMHRLAHVLEALGRFRDAEPYRREILDAHRQLLGPDDATTLRSLSALALLLDTLGEHDEAESLFRESLDGSRELHGDAHPATLSVLNNLGMLMDSMGRHDEAEGFYRESLQGLRKVHGDTHSHTLSTIGNLGLAMLEQGKADEARPYLQEALHGCREVFGPDHSRTLNAMNSMAVLLRELGELEEAEQLSREIVESAQRVLPPRHPDFAAFLSQRARTLIAMERPAEAETPALEAHDIFEGALGPTHPRTIGTASVLAELYALWHTHEPEAGYDAAAEAWQSRLSDADGSVESQETP